MPKSEPIRGLRFTGGERHIPGVPARDLDDADLARLAYVRLVTASRAAGEPDPDPRTVDTAPVRAELLGSGLYEEA